MCANTESYIENCIMINKRKDYRINVINLTNILYENVMITNVNA